MQRKTFQLQKKEKPENGIIRVLNVQIDLACSLCHGPLANIEDSIHEIRKTIKSIRSVIRLVRFKLGEEKFQEENNKFSNINLLLAELRRSDALLKTLYFIFNQPDLDIPVIAEQDLIKYFKREKNRLYRSLAGEKSILKRCSKQLSSAQDQLPDYLLKGITPKIILAGLKKTYKSGYKRLKKAIQDPSTENNHALRKAVKSLWNQLQVLRVLCPFVIGPYILSLDRLGDLLGTEHDLAELEQVIKENSTLQKKVLHPILSVIKRQRRINQQSAWKIVGRIYAETPSAFSKRMEVYWDLMLTG